MEETALSKRDKRLQNISRRLRQLNDSFMAERDGHYSDMLHALQLQLYALHQGNNPAFVEKLADLEELRDSRLTELYLWERYQTEQAEEQYQKDVAAATSEYDQMLVLVKEKLRARLEAQQRRLGEDRSLLDVAVDPAFFLAAAAPTDPGRGGPLSAADRRTLRRRELADEVSGVSGSEARTRRARGQAVGAASDAETAGSDRELDAVFKDFESAPTGGRHVAKSYQGVSILKNDEGLADIALIRDSSKRIRRR